jgi:hypothetical protein
VSCSLVIRNHLRSLGTGGLETRVFSVAAQLWEMIFQVVIERIFLQLQKLR